MNFQRGKLPLNKYLDIKNTKKDSTNMIMKVTLKENNYHYKFNNGFTSLDGLLISRELLNFSTVELGKRIDSEEVQAFLKTIKTAYDEMLHAHRGVLFQITSRSDY